MLSKSTPLILASSLAIVKNLVSVATAVRCAETQESRRSDRGARRAANPAYDLIDLRFMKPRTPGPSLFASRGIEAALECDRRSFGAGVDFDCVHELAHHRQAVAAFFPLSEVPP